MDRNKEKLVKLIDDNFVEIGKRLIRTDIIAGIQSAKDVYPDDNEGIVVSTFEENDIHIKELEYSDFMSQLQEAREQIEKEILEKMKVPAEMLHSDDRGLCVHTQLPEGASSSRVPNMPHIPYRPYIPSPFSLEERDKAEMPKHVSGKVVPLPSTPEFITTEIIIDNLDLSSASGEFVLSDREIIVDRQRIVIKDSSGRELGRGHESGGGTIHGSNVSGIINCSGKYRLVFKEYSGEKAFVSYYVERK